MIPPEVIQIRRELCKCEGVNHADPCAACPQGHFGRYEQTGCDDPSYVAPMSSTPSPTHSTLRPGDVLAKIIHQLTGVVPCGACQSRIAYMNERGWFGCWKDRRLIAGWIKDEANKRGHDLDDASAMSLFKAALRELRMHPKLPSVQKP